MPGGLAATAVMGWWRAMPGPLKVVVVLVAFCVVVVAVGAATGAKGTRAATVAAKRAGTPLSCLRDAGLSQVGQRGASTWRGFHTGPPFFDVFVDDAGTPGAARAAVIRADLVVADAGGRYAVTGPGIHTDDGGVVLEVADCLGG